MRNAFVYELMQLARANPRIALVVGDLGYGVVEPFALAFPERFFNAGVAEQNMMGLSAGLASEGFHVFAYSIANFPTFRCAEQIRNDVDYHQFPVTVVAVGGGLAYGNLGYSHHAVQDYALMRVMPNILIAAPGDPMEVRACMRYLVANPQPSYLRLGKAGEPSVHSQVPKVTPGQWLQVRTGGEIAGTYLSTGAALDLVDQVSRLHPAARGVCTLPLWSMKTKHLQVPQIARYCEVVTVEDHLLDGGFGSWMLESVLPNPDLMSRIKVRALNSRVCGMVGRQSTLNSAGGLTGEALCE